MYRRQRRDPRRIIAMTLVALPVLVPLGVYILAKGSLHYYKLAHEDVARHKKQWRHTHRRRLSDLVDPPKPTTERNQRQAAFLAKLPLEIRQMVYEHYYGSTELTIRLLPQGRFGSQFFSFTDFKDEWYSYRPVSQLRWNQGRAPKALLHLPLACRQIYSESIEYLYSCNTFRFSTIPDLFKLDQVFLPQRLRSLKTLAFELPYGDLLERSSRNQEVYLLPEWTQTCLNVAAIPGLNRLRVDLLRAKTAFDGSRVRTSVPNQEHTDWILQPLDAVRSLTEFDVRLHWDLTNVARFRNSPFNLWWRDDSDHWHSIADQQAVLRD